MELKTLFLKVLPEFLLDDSSSKVIDSIVMRANNYNLLGRALLWISIMISIHCRVDCNYYADLKHNPPSVGVHRDNCGEPSVYESLLIHLISNSKNLRIQSPSNRGNLNVRIQKNEFILKAGQTSERFGIETTQGVYKITSETERILLDRTDFDFSKSIRDGIVVRNEFTLESNRCYLLDGVSGNAVEKDCADF